MDNCFVTEDNLSPEFLKISKEFETMFSAYQSEMKSQGKNEDYIVYPIQICKTCEKLNLPIITMSLSNDGNKHQTCTNCGWEWHASE